MKFKPTCLNSKFTPLVTALSIAMLSQNAQAIDIGEGNGKLDASIKAMHVVSGKDNGFDPDRGTGYLLKLKYVTPTKNNLKAGFGAYASGDLFGLTDFDSGKPALGMFVTDEPGNEGDTFAQLGEAYLDWTPENYHVYGGRMTYKTPLTNNAPSSLMPSFFTVFGASTTALHPDLEIGLARATQMSMGARTRTEFGLIGEKTGSAGTGFSPVTPNPATNNGQAEFVSISEATLGANADSTDGMTVLNATYTGIKGVKLSVWDYYVHDIANNIYLEAEKTIPMKGKKVKLSGQYLTQTEVGDELAGDLDFNMLGVKASVGNKKWNAYAAMNSSSGDSHMLNAWGGDPAYTSSIFSRNAYREDVNAYKVGGHYKFAKGWMVKAGYANYGQSAHPSSQTDATELDVMLVWKPMKKTVVKLFHANRTSELDGAGGADKTQAHTRLIAQYSF